MADDDTELSYEEVLDYLADREGDPVTVSSYPTFRKSDTPTALGLQFSAELGKVEAVKPYQEQFLDGRAGVRVRFGDGYDDGLVLTREWFGSAGLSPEHSRLTIVVFATPDRPPFYPPVGQERPDGETRDVPLHELVGWGFAFDFDGSPPISGRWARPAEEED